MLEPSSSDDDSDNDIGRDEFDGVSTKSTTSNVDNSRSLNHAGGSFSSNRSETNSSQRSPSIGDHSSTATPCRTQNSINTNSINANSREINNHNTSNNHQRPVSPSPSIKNEREKVS